MQRARENSLLRPLLDREAKIHHEHVVRDVTHDAEIVRDEEIRDTQIALQVGQKIEDLRLHRDVERGDRLVGDEQAAAAASSARAIAMRWRWPPENICG